VESECEILLRSIVEKEGEQPLTPEAHSPQGLNPGGPIKKNSANPSYLGTKDYYHWIDRTRAASQLAAYILPSSGRSLREVWHDNVARGGIVTASI